MHFLFGCLTLCILINFQSPEIANHKSSLQEWTEKNRILFIVSNAHYYGETKIPASNHFLELVAAYDVLIKAGFQVDFVSPEGGAIPIGYINTSDPLQKKYLYDHNFMQHLKTTNSPDQVNSELYAAVYYGGGGAAMFGVPENMAIQNLVMKIYEEQDGVISAICHGTAGILHLKTKSGDYLVSGKKANGFPDIFENTEAEYYQSFPFSIQQLIVERGGIFDFSEEGWDGFSVVDNRLITGQDPSSAGIVAQHIIKKLKKESISLR